MAETPEKKSIKTIDLDAEPELIPEGKIKLTITPEQQNQIRAIQRAMRSPEGFVPKPAFPSAKMESIVGSLRQFAQDQQELAQDEMAIGFVKRLERAIIDFDAELDQGHEVALKLVTFGQAITLHVTSLGCQNPSLITFYGSVDGQPATLIQHVSQISFLLTSVQRADPTSPKTPFGFHSSVVTEFTDKAKQAGMNWDEVNHCWVDGNGKCYTKTGNPIE